jgi:hypothetical protein
MSVSLSPIGGAASQFFNSGGVPLAGGKIYTYEAGTTTPKACYTSASGLVAHSNPIILDSTGRIPGGEIWLTSAQAYLFILKSSNDTLIGTYDNIYGYSAGAETAVTEVQIATAGQTSFTLTSMVYTPTTHTLGVYIDGVNQVVNNSYVETSATTVTFVSGLHVGAVVKFININSAATSSDLVTYLPAGAGADTTTVQAKLRESVSVLDFYANGVSGVRVDPTGVVDSTLGIQAALNSFTTMGGLVLFPVGQYKTTATLVVPPKVSLLGVLQGSWSGSVYDFGTAIVPAFSGNTITMTGVVGHDSSNVFENITIIADKATYPAGNGFLLANASNVIFRRCRVLNIGGHGFVTGDATGNSYHNYFYNCYTLGAGANGFECLSRWARFVDCWADTCQIGINISSTGASDNARIIRCHFEEHEQAAIKISGGAGHQGGHIIQDNTIYSRRYILADPGYGIWLDTTTSASGCTGITISGNSLVCETTYVANTGTVGIYIGNGAAGNQITENQVGAFAINIQMGTGCSGTVFTDNYFNGFNGTTCAVVASASIWKGNYFTNSVGTYSISAVGVLLQLVANNFDKSPNCAITSQVSANVGYGAGTWVPVFTGLTVVNGTGGATYSGKYHIEGNMMFWEVSIVVTGTCTTSSAGGGATFFNGIPATGNPSVSPFTAQFDSGVTTIGTGVVSGTNGYCPAWVATNSSVRIYGNFMLV